MIKRKNNGFVIELMLVFMLITFGFCLVLNTFMMSLNTQRKYAKKEVMMEADLNQIGEYYIRSVEAGKEFPTGSEANYNAAKFNWMDDNAKQFFADCKENYKFTYKTEFAIEQGDFWTFFREKYILRRLCVKAGSANKMVVVIKETKVDNTKATYDIMSWSTGSNITLPEGGGYSDDDQGLLRDLWQFFGVADRNLVNWVRNGGSFLKLIVDTFGDFWYIVVE